MKSLIRLDPFRTMRRWDPFEDLRSVQHQMDRLFDRFLGSDISPLEATIGEWTPAVECYTKEGHMMIKAELPGVDPKDLDVSITERELVIKGERKAEKTGKEDNYSFKEIAYGSFERRFMLPEGVLTENVKAKFSNGILEVRVPVPEISKPKKIEIETKEAKKIEAEPAIRKAA